MEARVQDSLRKIDDEASKIQRDLEKNYIRGVQGQALRKGADCCDNGDYSAEEVQACIQKTQQPISKIQRVIRQELEEFQKRLQRCLETCQDNAKVAMQVSGNGADAKTRVEKDFGDCMCVCSDQHFNLMPLLRQRLVDQVSMNIEK